uniref:Uncharacterized protein n=1 Tax=Romanomermis culicivorax TaxID=13658 RepID=A0A915IYW0_ROMCU
MEAKLFDNRGFSPRPSCDVEFGEKSWPRQKLFGCLSGLKSTNLLNFLSKNNKKTYFSLCVNLRLLKVSKIFCYLPQYTKENYLLNKNFFCLFRMIIVENSGHRITYNFRFFAFLLVIFACAFPTTILCFQPFDDSTLFKIDWPGRSTSFNAEEIFHKYSKVRFGGYLTECPGEKLFAVWGI